MNTQRQIIDNSINDNILLFLKTVEVIDAYRLCMYLGSRYITDELDEVQTKFVDGFFGLDEWNKFISFERIPEENRGIFHPRPPFDLDSVRNPLMFHVLQNIPDLLMETSNLRLEKSNIELDIAKRDLSDIQLKVELQQAFEDSYDDDKVFDKIDGFCNITDVLRDKKLLKFPEDMDE